MKNIFELFKKPEAHQIITNPNLADLRRKYALVWKDKKIPLRQMKIVQKQLPGIEKVPAIIALIKFIRATNLKRPSVLEIGCSTGYHFEAFKRASTELLYAGCDYSSEFIRIARQKYPEAEFKIDDATSLHYKNESFNIVISGCCILHIIDYQKAIKEAARVAKEFVIFHRTPVIHIHPTTYTKKIGYGLEMVEILFNEEELLNDFQKNGMSTVAVNSHSQFEVSGLAEPVFMKEYLCIKQK